MKTQPIRCAPPAGADSALPAPADAFERARHVCLTGNGLPQRWRGRSRFVMLQTGFGLGHAFLAAWAAWRADPRACERLVFISIEQQPPALPELRRVHAAGAEPRLAAELLQRWPSPTPNLHRLSFEGGRLQLLLALGDMRDWLGELVAEVDAFHLAAVVPTKEPGFWDGYALKRLARLAGDGATVACGNAGPGLCEGLRAAGFEVALSPGLPGAPALCTARFQPRHPMQRPAGRLALAPLAHDILIIGAGLAGAACAHALREQGLSCRVLEARPGPAQAASGNPGGLFHGTLNPDDGVHARFNRAAALETERLLHTLGPQLPWLQRGLLRLETRRSAVEMQALIDKLGLPDDYVRALAPDAAARLSGLQLQSPAWFYPGGGALPPQAYTRALLGDTALLTERPLAALRRLGERWQALDAQGRVIDQASALVLAGGHESLALLDGIAHRGRLPLQRQRGQISHLPAPLVRQQGWPVPRLPVAGAGYAIADGLGGLWCGATAQDDDLDPCLRTSDHGLNLAQYRSLAGMPASTLELPPSGRVGWRMTSPDRLPVLGGLVDPDYAGRDDQVRLMPRLPGLAICTALGSRGIGWAALCGQVLASRLSGAPVPLEAGLLDAIDPARWPLRP